MSENMEKPLQPDKVEVIVISDDDDMAPETLCRMSLGIEEPDFETDSPGPSGTAIMDIETDSPGPSGTAKVDFETDSPGPSGTAKVGETFNRDEYEIPPRLMQMSDQSSKSVQQFLDLCMPRVTERDRPLILQKIKELLNRTNLHYLVSEQFRDTVASLLRSVQENKSRSNVYLRIKDLADKLRIHLEKKTFTGTSEEDTSGFDSLASQSTLAASLSSASSSVPPGSSWVARNEIPSVAVVEESSAYESVGRNHEGRWSNGVDVTGETSGTSQLSKKQRWIRHCIRKLEKHLYKYNKVIKKLSLKEVDFNSDDAESAYVLKGRFEKKAVAVWRKLCSLQQRHASTGREREKKFHYEGTRYAEINAMVENLINRRRHHHRVFPDFKDVLDVVHSGNRAHKLGLSAKDEESLAEDVFKGVGRELQKRRQKDELSDALAYLEDCPCEDFSDDPALDDEELLEKLETNAEVSQMKLNEVMEVYVAKQVELEREAQEREQDNGDVSAHPSESDESEDADEDEEEYNEDDEGEDEGEGEDESEDEDEGEDEGEDEDEDEGEDEDEEENVEEEDEDYSRHSIDISPAESVFEQNKKKLDSKNICDSSSSKDRSHGAYSQVEDNDYDEVECAGPSQLVVVLRDVFENEQSSRQAEAQEVGAEGSTLPADEPGQGTSSAEGAVAEGSTACSGLLLLPMMPIASSAASGMDRKRSLEPATPHDIITIASDDEEEEEPAAKMPKL
ncbi:uncharacterized protein LOC119161096 isoform X2 [Rhipicephalus microplus]|uniref:uncharacterized protein LOC119161096 isoform X2 n=1 Tax=Rhipicephalus microplus TaxID=6941 RepID=UPI003F6D2229